MKHQPGLSAELRRRESRQKYNDNRHGQGSKLALVVLGAAGVDRTRLPRLLLRLRRGP